MPCQLMLYAEPGVLSVDIWLSLGDVVDDVIGFLLVLVDVVLHLPLLVGFHQRVGPIAEGIGLVFYVLLGQILYFYVIALWLRWFLLKYHRF